MISVLFQEQSDLGLHHLALFAQTHPIETVLSVPGESSGGLTDIFCNFGSGESVMSGFSLFTL